VYAPMSFRDCRLGTTLGPHGVRDAERSAHLCASGMPTNCRRPAETSYRNVLGVKWSQVQILSARLRKCVLSCRDRSFIPQEWFSLYVLGTTFLWYLTILDALVRWSSEPRIQVALTAIESQ
jgi:hypothetical protein